MAGNRKMANMERDMETEQDAQALKRVAAMRNDKNRFDRAKKRIDGEQREVSGAGEVATGLRKKR